MSATWRCFDIDELDLLLIGWVLDIDSEAPPPMMAAAAAVITAAAAK